MNSQPNQKAVYCFAALHIILPVLGWLIGMTLYNQFFSLSSAITDFLLSIPLFDSTYWRMSEVYGSAAANRMVYLTFYWVLSLIPLGIAYFWLGIWSALRISSGKQKFKLGSLVGLAIGGFAFFYLAFFSDHSFSSQTRLERVVLRTDYKFIVYTCAAISGLWASVAVVQPITLLIIKISKVVVGNKVGTSHER